MTPTLALSVLQQQDVWEGWITSEMRANYFAELGQSFDRQQKICNWLTTVTSSGAFVTAVSGLGHGYVVGLTLIAALLSAFLLVQQNQKRVTDCLDLHFRWNRLAGEYNALWNDMYSDDAPTKLSMLAEKATELSKSSAAFPIRKKMMLKWQKHVEMLHAGTVSA